MIQAANLQNIQAKADCKIFKLQANKIQANKLKGNKLSNNLQQTICANNL